MVLVALVGAICAAVFVASPAAQPQETAPAAQSQPQNAVLYEEGANDTQVRRYAGSARWRTARIAAKFGGPPETVIQADVGIPERTITMSFSLRRNTDPSLPASHTIELVFRLPRDFEHGTILDIPGILMKETEQNRAAPLAGTVVKVTDGFFLMGLSTRDKERERNLQMLRERAWFDIPLVYTTKRRAILALEKGRPGERAFTEAFAAWQ